MKSSILFILLIGFISCSNPSKKSTEVDFAETNNQSIDKNSNGESSVYIAIASMTSPQETFAYYSELINYISEKAGYPILIKQKKTYKEVNEMLDKGEVDFAFICSGAFAEEYHHGKMKLLVAPQIDQSINYQAYIIAHQATNISSFEGFEGKSFAFTDPLSNTGRAYPYKRISEVKKEESSFFRKTVYTYGHDISIQMVNQGLIDGASVHGLIYNYVAEHHPEKVKNTYIVEKSEKFGMPPVVVPSSLDDSTYQLYQNIFLNLHNDSIGMAILNKLSIDQYMKVSDSIYSSVFQLNSFISEKN